MSEARHPTANLPPDWLPMAAAAVFLALLTYANNPDVLASMTNVTQLVIQWKSGIAAFCLGALVELSLVKRVFGTPSPRRRTTSTD